MLYDKCNEPNSNICSSNINGSCYVIMFTKKKSVLTINKVDTITNTLLMLK